MSDEELQEKALGVAKHTLSGKTDLERAAVMHQHIGSRAMGDMVIETFEPSPGEAMHVVFPINKLKRNNICKQIMFLKITAFLLKIREEVQTPALRRSRRA